MPDNLSPEVRPPIAENPVVNSSPSILERVEKIGKTIVHGAVAATVCVSGYFFAEALLVPAENQEVVVDTNLMGTAFFTSLWAYCEKVKADRES